jgi:uncharacterized membrane protein YdjX (TVP38/TMEM64 family)
MLNKKLLLMVFIVVVFSILYFDLLNFLTLEKVKGSIDEIKLWRNESPLKVIAGFSLLYIVITALSLPGAALFSLSASALFGLAEGIVIAIFSSSIGALLAFLISRYMFREIIKKRFPEQLNTIDNGIKRQGSFYLFSLRLVPVIPFFLVNMLMGVTAVRSWTFYWVSVIGMSAVTATYVNAGTQLSKIESISSILSLEMILSLSLLGLLPFIIKIVFKK